MSSPTLVLSKFQKHWYWSLLHWLTLLPLISCLQKLQYLSFVTTRNRQVCSILQPFYMLQNYPRCLNSRQYSTLDSAAWVWWWEPMIVDYYRKYFNVKMFVATESWIVVVELCKTGIYLSQNLKTFLKVPHYE